MTKAQHAIHAAQHLYQWGRSAALKYAVKRDCLSAYRLACQLEAVSHG